MPPPGLAPTSEPCGEHITAETATDVSTGNAKLRYLMSELHITRPQAHRLIRAYEADQRDARHRDAREFVREEFGPWLRRRGDLLVVRGKAQHAWRTSS